MTDTSILQLHLSTRHARAQLIDALASADASVVTLGAIIAVVIPVSILGVCLLSSARTSKAPTVTYDGPLRKLHSLPTRLPVLGNLLDVIQNKHRRHDFITETCEYFKGEPISFKILGQPPAVTVYTVQAVEDVLKTQFENHPKGPMQREVFRDILGHGIFAADGEQWVHQRKTASNLFTARALRDTVTESMRRYTVVLGRILQKASDTNNTLDLFKLMNAFTIEAFAKMGFGIDMNCLEGDEDHRFQSAFDGAQRILLRRFQRPQWFWKLQRFLNVGTEAQLKKDLAVIDSTVMEIITGSLARRQQITSIGAKPVGGDIVSLFLDRYDAASSGEFDPNFLRDIVLNFLIAGRDTTAQAMSWFFYNISKKPEFAAKIRDEIRRVLPELADGRISSPSMDQVQQLTYLEAAIKETLRLHPSVPIIPKSTLEDTVLSDGTFLAKGSLVAIAVYAMGRMEFIWGPDAKEFKPERWIDPATHKIKKVSSFQFVSFNAGPRSCLGMNLAMLEMKIVLASVLSRFQIELLAPDKVIYDNSLTLPVRGKMPVHVSMVASSSTVEVPRDLFE